MRLLLDHNIPLAIGRYLPEHDVTHASALGWGTLSNGSLMAAGEEAGFDVLITADQSIQFQQNLSRRRITIMVLATNHWNTIRDNIDRVITGLHGLEKNALLRITFPVPIRRRRFPRVTD
jgi:hypothetical protein